MASNTNADPPKSTDLYGWQEVVAQGRLREMTLESVAAAFQDLCQDRRLHSALAKYLSDFVYIYLRKKVSKNQPNKGKDLADRVHMKVFDALARPGCADAVAYRKTFLSCLEYRLKDAIVEERRERGVPHLGAKLDRDREPLDEHGKKKKLSIIKPSSADEHPNFADIARREDDAGVVHTNTLFDGVRDTDQQIDVDRLLNEVVPDPKKREAFRLHMEGVPYKSKGANSIAKELDIDEATARKWVKEVQEQLKDRIGEQK